MFSVSRPGSPAPRDGAVPESPSELSCGVCGRYALEEDTSHEFATDLTDRLVCAVCGTHRRLGVS